MGLSRTVSNLLFIAFLLSSLAATVATTALAQSNSQPPPQPRSGQQAVGGQKIVMLNVIVTDEANHLVGDVRREEFLVFENGVAQTISFFSTDEQPALLYAIAIDNSGSFKSVLDPAIKAAQTIVAQNKPGDETMLVRFIGSEKIETLQDITADKEKLSEMLDTMYIDKGQTALIDAVYLTAQRLAKYQKDDGLTRREAIIVMSDGEDRSSYYTKKQLFELLRKEKIQIFIIGMVNGLSDDYGRNVSPRQRAKNFVNSLADESGGLAFFPKSSDELQKVADQFMLYLRKQYVIGYVPTGQTGTKPYHKVDVKLADTPERKKLRVSTRSGYIVPPGR